MRPYRGKRIDNGEWAYGYYAKKCVDEWDNSIDVIIEKDNFFPHEVHPASVEQSTGKKDNNGTEAYENDIIKVTAERNCAFDDYSKCKPFNASVFWEPYILCWFYEELKYGEGRHPLVNCLFEVIGNTTDNPELLEAE